MGNTVIESLGVYLPPKVVTTAEIVQGTKNSIKFPLERMTGIASRRMAGETEFSIDLAKKATAECLGMSKYAPEDIDLLICPNISRYDGPNHRVSFEPNTSLQLVAHFGFVNALAFDISNACAGMFTAINIANAFLRTGAIRTALVVSGEYITHLTRTAQLEIEDLMDLRLPCLTVGDAGAAVLLERSARDDVGLHDIEMYTLSRYRDYCIAKPTDKEHGGAIMFTDMIGTVRDGGARTEFIMHMLERNGRVPDDFQFFITHQISRTMHKGTMRQVNQVLNREFLHTGNLIDNLSERGNTATTTHFVAFHDLILDGRINNGDNVFIVTTGSGSTQGVALYTFDDLPDRLRAHRETGQGTAKTQRERPASTNTPQHTRRVRIESVGTIPDGQQAIRDSVQLMKAAAEDCLSRSLHGKSDIGLFINTGVYRSDFVFEPAVAALAAGELEINDLIDSLDEPRTFAFDIFNGAIGTLNACAVAAEMIEAGKFQTAMVVAAEIDNNLDAPGKPPLGLAEVGSALILDQSPDNRTGFGSFVFRTFAEHIGSYAAYTAQEPGKTFVTVEGDPYPEDATLACIQSTVQELLTREGLEPSQITAVFPPQFSATFIDRLSARLEIPREQFVDVMSEGENKDLYTSALPYALRRALDTGRVRSGDIGLIISVAAGIQVGCATYYF